MTQRTIHQIWLGSEVPSKYLEGMADWNLLNKGWDYRLWTRPLDGMVNQYFFDHAEDYVKPDAVWQFRADLMRYEILYRYGGFYADVDTVPLRPLGTVFAGHSEWAVAEDEDWVSNTYLYSEPGTDLFYDLVDGIGSHLAGASGLAATVASGPQYLTSVWHGHAGYVDDRTHLWFPYSWRDVRQRKEKQVEIGPDVMAVHLWGHSLDKRKDKDRLARYERKQR